MHLVRIILRTGQAGDVPEAQVMADYDINDYREKTELTSTKMQSAIIGSLRDYALLHMLDRSRKGLEHILRAAGDVGHSRAFGEFAEGIITQVTALLGLEDDGLLLKVDGFAARLRGSTCTMRAGTGCHAGQDIAGPLSDLPEGVGSILARALAERKNVYREDSFVGYMASAGFWKPWWNGSSPVTPSRGREDGWPGSLPGLQGSIPCGPTGWDSA